MAVIIRPELETKLACSQGHGQPKVPTQNYPCCHSSEKKKTNNASYQNHDWKWNCRPWKGMQQIALWQIKSQPACAALRWQHSGDAILSEQHEVAWHDAWLLQTPKHLPRRSRACPGGGGSFSYIVQGCVAFDFGQGNMKVASLQKSISLLP